MSKIDQAIKDLEARKKKIVALKQEWIKSPAAKAFGDDVIKNIKKRTRLGKGVREEGGEFITLDALAESTVKNREKYRKKLSKLTRPTKSNLTATGQMLEAIVYKIETFGFLFFFKSGLRDRELNGSGGKTDNATVARGVSDKRPFFALSRTELNGLGLRLKREFLKIIRGQ